MKIEDKAYFEMQPNLQGMKKVRDEIYALAQTHLRLSEKSTDSMKKYSESATAQALSSFVNRAPYAAEIGMEFKGSAYWNKKAMQLATEGAAYGVIADKLIAEALSIYNSHSKPVEDKRYFENATNVNRDRTITITRLLSELNQLVITREDDKAKKLATKIKAMIANNAVMNESKNQLSELNSIMLGKSFARQGSKAKMGFLSGTKKQQIDYVFGVGTNYGERAWKSGIKRLIDDKEALARIKLLKYELDPSSPMRNTVDKEFDKGWLKGYTRQQIQESENPPKFKKGDKVLYNTGTAKHIGTIEKVSPYAKPEAEYIVAFTTLSTGRSQLNIPESSISKSNASRTGTKSKFARMPFLGTILPTADSIAADNSYAKQVEQMKLQVANKELKGLDKRVVGSETRYYKTPSNYAIVSQSGKILWFVVKSDGDYKQKLSRTGTKSKFANRGAFAEASSSPVLGSLLEKKVMPEGGWRAVETDGAALVIAFEDGDIAGNFARRASENGYSATAPMAMAGRFWNVKVQNENKQ